MLRKDQGEEIVVLLVDPDRQARPRLQTLLDATAENTFSIAWAGTCGAAELELQKRAVDVALVEHRLGEKTGLDFITECAPLHPFCPMLLMSESAEPALDLAAERIGAAGYLARQSLTGDALYRTIRYARRAAQKQSALEHLLGSARSGLISLDEAGSPTIWNATALEMLGLEHGSAPDYFRAMIMETLRRVGAPAEGIREHVRSDGRALDIIVSRSPDGRSVVALHDVTMRHRDSEHLRDVAEQALQMIEARSACFANTSHELRTPLNGILGMLRVLESGPLNATQREGVAVIRSSAKSLLGLVDGILDMSKIEAGRMELESIEIPVAAMVDDIVRLLAPTALEKGIELTAFVNPAASPTLMGDPLRLRQVLTNLVGNAIKFTRSGAIRVMADEVRTNGASAFEFSVIDTGIGIPRASIDAIFGKFFQHDCSVSREYGGSGLGLSISKELVELMGGTISCVSREGEGSTFRVTLPLPDRDAAPTPAQPPDRQLAGVHILAVSPSQGLLETIHAYAKVAGAPLMTATSLETARNVLREMTFDAIVLDGTFGNTETAALIASLAPQAKLLLLESAPRQAQALGLADSMVLTRPFMRQTFDRLLARLKKRDGEPDKAAPAPHETRPLRILMAEDNPANQRVALAVLRPAGFQLEIVGNGLAAIDRALTDRFDVILMDVQMPVLDGLAATRKLRQIKSLRHLPVVGLTACASEEDRKICLNAGMTDYISKPIQWDQLLALLDRLDKAVYAKGNVGGTAAA